MANTAPTPPLPHSGDHEHTPRRMLRMFYFSGTGNVRNAAHWVAACWRERESEAEVVDHVGPPIRRGARRG